MNFVRAHLSAGHLLGQRCRQITHSWSHRGMCIKPQDVKGETPSRVPTNAQHAGFKVPGYRPSAMDKKMMVWSGRFKSVDQIPEFVSFEMIDAARNRVRVKACYVMIAVTLGACMFMVIQGKRAARRHESLVGLNMEKKAKWKEEVEQERDAALALSQKAQ